MRLHGNPPGDIVYAHVASFAQDEPARIWLDARLSGNTPVGPGLACSASCGSPPTRASSSGQRPWPPPGQVAAWLDCETTRIPQPTKRHREILESLLPSPGVQANLVPDAHLAALAFEHGLLLCSTDGDFARFPEVRWHNPL